ncbi:MAG: restriction endonuclease subunit S [Lactococcus lactis]|nr:restriction endonuclease subunit S [Lactococcus lactis]
MAKIDDSVKKKVPELRFPGFTDDWEERKVKDIFKITRGQVLAATETSEEKSDISPFPVYSSQTKNNGLMGYYKDYLFDTAITWTTDGANAGTVSYRSGRFYSTNVNGVLISDKGYTNKAISEILNLEAWKWVSHVGNPKLMNNVMGDISIMIPSSFEEQDRLSDFLNQLDDTIALHQRKLDLLKEQKKGYLQKMFPKNGAKVPELRFAGFADDWEERKLGELGSVAMNKRIFKDQTSEIGDIPFFKIGTFGGEADAYISRKLYEEYKQKYPYPKVGDILISASGSIGRTVVYQGEEEYFQDSNIVWLNHDERLNNRFLKQFYSIVTWQGLEGSTIKRLYNKNILETKISIPTPNEQEKIGLFFEKIDDTIDLHQFKLDLLKEQKKGFLQKMFV